MATPLEIASALKRTEEGNNDHYYGGGDTAYTSLALAYAGVPLAVRKGRTVGIWENGKVVEYMWHTDTSNTGLIKKTADVDVSGKEDVVNKTDFVRDRSSASNVNYPSELAVANLMEYKGGSLNINSFTGGQTDIATITTGGISHPVVPGRYNNIYNFVGSDISAKNFSILTDYHADSTGSGGFLYTGAFIYVNNNSNQIINVSIPDVWWDGVKSKTLALKPGFYLILNKYNQNYDPNDGIVRSFFKTIQLAPSFAVTNYSATGALRLDSNNQFSIVPASATEPGTMTAAHFTKVASIEKAICAELSAPKRDFRVYFKNASVITQIILDGASNFQYSKDGGQSYPTPTLPLTTQTKISLPANTWVRFRIAFTNNTTSAAVYIELE